MSFIQRPNCLRISISFAVNTGATVSVRPSKRLGRSCAFEVVNIPHTGTSLTRGTCFRLEKISTNATCSKTESSVEIGDTLTRWTSNPWIRIVCVHAMSPFCKKSTENEVNGYGRDFSAQCNLHNLSVALP